MGAWRRCLPLVLACAVATPNAAAQAVLAVSASDGAKMVELPLEEGQSWCLLWNHSVAGFTVRDCFVWQSPHLRLQSSHQPDFAAGLGHFQGRGQMRVADEGGYLIDCIDEKLPDNRLILRVGARTVDHRIKIGDQIISLSERAAGERVGIQVVVQATAN